MLTKDQVRGCLAEEWGLPAAELTRLDGGMGSRTWIVDDSSRRWVLKAVAPGLGGRPAVVAVVTALARPGLRAWSTGLLHADPAPGAFRFDRVTGRCGVIDWSTALYGPLLYDLASAAMFLGGLDRAAEMSEAYLATGVLSRAETEEGLALMLRLRWAVQADYFARRITSNDLTGIAGPEDNEKGLEDARRALTALGSPALLRLTPRSRAAPAGGRSGRTATRRRW